MEPFKDLSILDLFEVENEPNVCGRYTQPPHWPRTLGLHKCGWWRMRSFSFCHLSEQSALYLLVRSPYPHFLGQFIHIEISFWFISLVFHSMCTAHTRHARTYHWSFSTAAPPFRLLLIFHRTAVLSEMLSLRALLSVYYVIFFIVLPQF